MRKYLLFSLIISITFIFTACEQLGFKGRKIEYSDGLIVVRGKNAMTDVMTINPGTIVRFEETTGLWGGGEPGELEITDGGKLVAQGTAQSPIVFENGSQSTGHIYLRENASSENMIEYCHNNGIEIDVECSVTIERCKFNEGMIMVTKSPQLIIQYNTIQRTQGSSAIGIGAETNGSTQIHYNNISGGECGIGLGIAVSIENNNITNTSTEAIYAGPISPVTVNGNYISDCNGKTGADTTGIQSHNVIYSNPQSIPVSTAGCGW